MESSEHNWANISETICPKLLTFGKQASWMLFFQNSLTNPIISQISFFMTSHFGTLYKFKGLNMEGKLSCIQIYPFCWVSIIIQTRSYTDSRDNYDIVSSCKTKAKLYHHYLKQNRTILCSIDKSWKFLTTMNQICSADRLCKRLDTVENTYQLEKPLLYLMLMLYIG